MHGHSLHVLLAKRDCNVRRQEELSFHIQRKEETDSGDRNHPFLCPITLEVMKDPVVTPHGICFEREAIVHWVERVHSCPVTRKPLSVDQLITCYSLKSAIEEYERFRTVSSPSSSSSSSSSHKPSPPKKKPTINIEVEGKFLGQVGVWTSRSVGVDEFMKWNDASRYIVFSSSQNFVVTKTTGYICLENRGNNDVTIISRQREPNILELSNQGGKVGGTYILRAHALQGIDFRGWWCIEVPPDPVHSIDLLVYDFATKGGGKGNWLGMF